MEAGLGEDSALRTFLISTALLIAGEGESPAKKQSTLAAALERRLPAAALDALLDSCWIYRDESPIAWTPLHAVGAGFDRDDDADYVRLTAARSCWDQVDLAGRLDLVGRTVMALVAQYAQGTPQPVESSRRVFGDQEVMRGLANRFRNRGKAR